MSKYLCHRVNCKAYQMEDSTLCTKHWAELNSPRDPMSHLYVPITEKPEPDPEASVGSFEGQLGQVLAEMEELLLKKNKDYGSSYDKTVEELGETVILVRIMDKFNRLKQLLRSGEPAEVEETIEETLSDLVGYGIIELVRRRRL